jgi:hypothetical protein
MLLTEVRITSCRDIVQQTGKRPLITITYSLKGSLVTVGLARIEDSSGVFGSFIHLLSMATSMICGRCHGSGCDLR